MNICKAIIMVAAFAAMLLTLGCSGACTRSSRYMGGEVTLKTAPNGAVVNAEVLETAAKIVYLEPVTEKVADGVWCIGGHSVGNTTVIEADDGLIVYDTGDNKEEGEHLRKAIAEISDKPIKAIIYSHSHYALGAGALVDNPDDVLVIGHPKLNETVQSSLQGGGSPSAIPEVGPIMTARGVDPVQQLRANRRPGRRAWRVRSRAASPPRFCPRTRPWRTVRNWTCSG